MISVDHGLGSSLQVGGGGYKAAASKNFVILKLGAWSFNRFGHTSSTLEVIGGGIGRIRRRREGF